VTRVVLGLGSNLGDRLATLQAAVDRLTASGLVSIDAVSSVYETDPVGGPDQPDYLNVVALADTTLSPHGLLSVLQALEADLGRVRTERWGARTLDIDVIDYEGVVSDDPALTLPHPRSFARAFVLAPWVEVDPSAVAADGRRAGLELGALDASGVRRRPDLALLVPA
jgi:2-amino-4-hydroxy-6-hydroxymethyldihydropteridine diphosphokinase